MKHHTTGEIKEYAFRPVEYDEAGLEAQMRGRSLEGWSVWVMVSEVSKNAPKTPLRTRVVWADLDAKNYPGGVDQALKNLSRLSREPDILVESGHGLHVYWRLETDVAPEAAQIFSKDVQWQLGGDAVHDPTRMMRVPGTVNPKDPASPVECRVLAARDGTTAIDDVPSDPILARLGHKLALAVVNGSAFSEDRSAFDYKIAASLVEHGLSDEEITHLFLRYGLSGKVFDEGGNGPGYVRRTVRAVRSRVTQIAHVSTENSPTPAPSWVAKSFEELLETTKPDFLVENFLPRGGVGLLAAPPKARKSWAALQLAYAVASGTPWWGFEVGTAGKVLYVQAELTEWTISQRLRQLYGLDFRSANLKFVTVSAANLMMPTDLGGFEALVEAEQPDLVIIDPIANFFSVNENSSQEVNALFDRLAFLKDRKCALMLVHHAGKTEDREINPRHIRGSSVFFARPDAIVTLSVMSEAERLAKFELRAAPPVHPMALSVLENGSLEPMSPKEYENTVQYAFSSVQRSEEDERIIAEALGQAVPAITPALARPIEAAVQEIDGAARPSTILDRLVVDPFKEAARSLVQSDAIIQEIISQPVLPPEPPPWEEPPTQIPLIVRLKPPGVAPPTLTRARVREVLRGGS